MTDTKTENTATHETEVTAPQEGETKATWKVRNDLLELVRRQAYWDRSDDKEVVNAALEAWFQGKTYDPIPPNSKRNKGGRPPKKK